MNQTKSRFFNLAALSFAAASAYAAPEYTLSNTDFFYENPSSASFFPVSSTESASFGFTTGAGSSWDVEMIGVFLTVSSSVNYSGALFATDAQGLPSGTSLATFAYDWHDGKFHGFTPESSVTLEGATSYTFVISANAGSAYAYTVNLNTAGASNYESIDGWSFHSRVGYSSGNSWSYFSNYRGLMGIVANGSGSQIPEPSSAAALAGALGLALVALRRSTRA